MPYLPLNKDDGFIKVYEMYGGGKGDIVNPSKGWQYIQNISIGDSKSTSRHPRLGSTVSRIVTKGSDMTLTVGRWHVGGDEFKFANNNEEYIIDLLFYDFLSGVPETSAHTIQLAYCKRIGRDFATGAKANLVTRKWGVGEITDSAISEISEMHLETIDVPFTNVPSVEVNHSLGANIVKRAWVLDTNGREIDAPIQVTASIITADFSSSRSGILRYLLET